MKKLNIFYTTCSDTEKAKKLSRKVISDNYASCINIIKNIDSCYKENQKIFNSTETILIIKTIKKFDEIEKYLNIYHPYEIPFIGKFNMSSINKKYLDWIFKNL